MLVWLYWIRPKPTNLSLFYDGDLRKVLKEHTIRTGQAHNAFPEYTTNLQQFVVQSFLKLQVVSFF